jgi:hypothetical protein
MPFGGLNPRFNFARSQSVALNQIDRWGRDGVLRRNGRADVPVRACFVSFSPQERRGRVVDPLDRKALVPATDQNGNAVLEPDPDRDRLIIWQVDQTMQTVMPLTQDENLAIIEKPGRIDPAGTLLFWRLYVRR